MRPIQTKKWRKRNRAFRSEATDLLRILAEENASPAVIYADPPYTDDHYSRYYHLWETLVLYDYPTVSGKGQYRPDRFASPFSLRTQVEHAFEALVAGASSLQSTFVLSYPQGGLLDDSTDALTALLKRHFRKVSIASEIDHSHSTIGCV
jgi:adenine-specific DNA-methyltransferase